MTGEQPTPPADGFDEQVVLEGEPAEAPPEESPDELTQVTAQRDEYLDSLQRMKAEFDNYRKRAERDRVAQARSGARDLIVELLPVLDNLDRAIDAVAGRDEQVIAGLGIVRGQLGSVLAARGVSEIQAAEGNAFDPNHHDAVVSVPSPAHQDGCLVAVTEKGYLLDDNVLRPAKVAVAQNPTD